MKYYRNSNSKDAGFTLVEIILVVVLLSVVSAVALPNFANTRDKFTLNTASGNVSYLMRYAQSRAIAKGTNIKMLFDLELKKYWLLQHSSEDDVSVNDASEYGKIENRYGRVFKLPKDVDLVSEEREILFYPDGRIDKVSIGLCLNEKCMEISTKEARGRVKVFSKENL